MANRVPLVQISSRAWEHPADRAALNTLRAIPGFDEIVRKVAGFFGERGIRQLFLGDAVQGHREPAPAAERDVDRGARDARLAGAPGALRDARRRSPTRWPSASTSRSSSIHSGLLEILDEDELRSCSGTSSATS